MGERAVPRSMPKPPSRQSPRSWSMTIFSHVVRGFGDSRLVVFQRCAVGWRRCCRWRPRSGCQDSITRWSEGRPTDVTTTSSNSTLNHRADGSGRTGSDSSTARPLILASPIHSLGLSSGGSGEGLCSAKRWSRRRSAPFTDPGIRPRITSPSRNSSSIPLIRASRPSAGSPSSGGGGRQRDAERVRRTPVPPSPGRPSLA